MIDAKAFRREIRTAGGVNRRALLAYAAAFSSSAWLPRAGRAESRPSFGEDPFSLGVASGDPSHDGVVLWTRLAPKPLEPHGGLAGTGAVEVRWEVAEDEAMNRVVRSGTALAMPQLGHSVHVELSGLEPDRWYWYRFRAGDADSPLGRTRTFPRPEVMPDRLKFAFASCQNYEQGLYTAYEQMARDDLDLVVHLGDYIYEYEAGRNGKVRTHAGPEIEALEDYRIRYAQYRADPLLHRMHAQCPWLVTWDDHEFDNNYADEISEESGVDPAEFLLRRASAYQAYYEMMPLRRRSMPAGPRMRLYRRAPFGRLADLLVLDTRQYRTDQPNGDRKSPLNEAALEPSNSMLGSRQRNWLMRRLLASKSTWNVLAQQVMMGMVGFPDDNGDPLYSMDQWPGYAAERMRLMEFLAQRRVPNPVVLTGDIHSHWVNELRVDDREAESAPVATEFVTTSISSGGNGVDRPAGHDALLAKNPCVRFHNRQRGYVRCTVTPSRWRSDYMVVDDVLKPGGNVTERASFVVQAGSPKVETA